MKVLRMAKLMKSGEWDSVRLRVPSAFAKAAKWDAGMTVIQDTVEVSPGTKGIRIIPGNGGVKISRGAQLYLTIKKECREAVGILEADDVVLYEDGHALWVFPVNFPEK